MSEDDADTRGMAVASLTLSIALMSFLRTKNQLSTKDIHEIIENALSRLELHESGVKVEIKYARAMIDGIGDALAEADRQKPKG